MFTPTCTCTGLEASSTAISSSTPHGSRGRKLPQRAPSASTVWTLTMRAWLPCATASAAVSPVDARLLRALRNLSYARTTSWAGPLPATFPPSSQIASSQNVDT